MPRIIAFFFLACLSFPTYAIYDLAQTGQSQSYTINDDGDLKLGREIPKQRFKDNLNGTLTDNLTGLIWLTDAYCANHYISGASSNTWLDAFAFIDALNSKTLISPCLDYSFEFTDWRVPNINELQSLIPKGLKNNASSLLWLSIPGNNSPGFINTNLVNIPVWSSTSYAASNNQAWTINLDSGKTQIANKSNAQDPRFIYSAVRGTSEIQIASTDQKTVLQTGDDGYFKSGIKVSSPRFVSLADGTVIDKLTGLNWLQDANCALSSGGSWQFAMNSVYFLLIEPSFFSTCPSYNKINKDTDWRIPNIHELQSLISFGYANPSLIANHPFTIGTDKAFWSSTTSNGLVSTSAWAVSFLDGSVIPSLAKTDTAYAWPVRGPIKFSDLELNAKEIEFDSQYISDQSVQKSLEITNTGTDELKIEKLTLSNSSNSLENPHFSIGQDGCSNRDLDPQTTCITSIHFDPKNSGELTAILRISSNALGLEDFIISIKGIVLDNTEEKSNPDCFIATAAYGSYLEPEVETLRLFRDKYLLTSQFGKNLVEIYYTYSPAIADIIRENETYRFLIRSVLNPVIFIVKYPVTSLIFAILSFIFLFKAFIFSRTQLSP